MPRKCIEDDCKKSPIYNYPDNSSRIYCRKHAKKGMRVVGQQYCQDPGCKRYALYNYPGETRKLYCNTHSKLRMINVKRKPCIYSGCKTQPYYNYPGKTVGIYCQKHALKDMINVYSKTCLYCSKIPSFNNAGEKYGIYCKEHADDGMIDVHSTKCKEPGCPHQASFAVVGTFTPTHCGEHKQNDMFNVRKKQCIFTGCNKTALFGTAKAQYCAEHKDVDMIDKQNPICLTKDCGVYASFGLTKPTHCNVHKLPAMKLLIGYNCQIAGCKKRASFNYGGLKAKYCGSDKKTGMINVCATRCIKKICNVIATYGYPGNQVQFCTTHHPEGTKLQPTKRCTIRNCNELALYGKRDAVHCEQHKTAEEFNLIERECSSCALLNVLDSNGVCKFCNPDAWKTIRLAKQKEIQALFKAEGLEFVSTDVTVNGGECGKERPDFLFEAAGHYVVVEVDEDQHKSRACECEQTRMVNISQSLGMPTVFLRYNPDRYTVSGKTVDTAKRCRHKTLINWLCKVWTLEPEELAEHGFLSVLHLYFDDYNSHNVVWETMMPLEK